MIVINRLDPGDLGVSTRSPPSRDLCSFRFSLSKFIGTKLWWRLKTIRHCLYAINIIRILPPPAIRLANSAASSACNNTMSRISQPNVLFRSSVHFWFDVFSYLSVEVWRRFFWFYSNARPPREKHRKDVFAFPAEHRTNFYVHEISTPFSTLEISNTSRGLRRCLSVPSLKLHIWPDERWKNNILSADERVIRGVRGGRPRCNRNAFDEIKSFFLFIIFLVFSLA